MNRLTAQIPPTTGSLARLALLLRAMAGVDAGPLPERWLEIELALHEVAVNVIEHARPSTDLTVAIDLTAGTVTVDLTDDGAAFDPRTVPTPDPAELPESGFGIHIARELVDRLVYETRPGWNRWTLIKELDA